MRRASCACEDFAPKKYWNWNCVKRQTTSKMNDVLVYGLGAIAKMCQPLDINFRTQCASNCFSLELVECDVHTKLTIRMRSSPLCSKLIIKIKIFSGKQFGIATVKVIVCYRIRSECIVYNAHCTYSFNEYSLNHRSTWKSKLAIFHA